MSSTRAPSSIDKFTTSLLGWISFSWVEIMLRTAERSQYMTVDDLPELDHGTRGETVYDTWKAKLPAPKAASVGDLWWTLLRSHRAAISAQVAITLLLSVLSLVPQLALLRIIVLLESPQNNRAGPLWVPVVGLGLSVMASATLETLKYWISYNLLAIRAQQQLSYAIFDKAVRQTDTGDTHSPVNLVAVDVKNISDFLCFSFLIYESPLKLGLALTFLVFLLGWTSVLTGIAVLSLLTVVNTFAGRSYSHSQRGLMHCRDHRLRLVSEMLQGIRQIKFSAQESRCEEKVNDLRNTEMRAQ